MSPALLAACEQHAAAPGATALLLEVDAGNAPARRLYASCGFEAFGTEPMAVRVGEDFVGKVHMWRETENG